MSGARADIIAVVVTGRTRLCGAIVQERMNEASGNRKKFFLYPSRTTLGWRVIRMVSQCKGESMVVLGEWRRVLDTARVHIGYQVCAPEMSRGDYELPSTHSSAAITVREMQINAGLMGQSRTEGMRDGQRQELRVEEDRIERVRAKVFVWPNVCAESGDVLRVWPRG